MTINAKKTDWTILNDVAGQGQAAGTRPGGSGSLVHNLPLDSEGFYVIEPASANLIAELDSYFEVWLKATVPVGSALQWNIFARAGVTDGYAIQAFYNEPTDTLGIAVARFPGSFNNAVTIAGIELTPLAPHLNFIGLRCGIADTPQGPRLEISYNINGAGWVLLADIVDVGDTTITGNIGKWSLLVQTTPAAGMSIQMDDIVFSNSPVPVDPPVITYPLTEGFEDGSWA